MYFKIIISQTQIYISNFIFPLDYFILDNEDFALQNVESLNTTKKHHAFIFQLNKHISHLEYIIHRSNEIL